MNFKKCCNSIRSTFGFLFVATIVAMLFDINYSKNSIQGISGVNFKLYIILLFVFSIPLIVYKLRNGKSVEEE
ncbi:MAG: hypothetical protein CR982_05550 [Candidatus Cloacimonadota bacterium]|nr:MAG: hypothetical protein CR982_05550 [Candidatus Cloacimonadota bacterium]PIE81412.1 MAG: hypothetical protein CSA15_00820 [Candidatus Delongbacteria bacterium]